MNIKQNAKFRMFHTVYNHLMANISLWDNIAGFKAAMNRFQIMFQTIGELVGEKARKLAGVTISKQLQKIALVDMTLLHSSLLVAMANEMKNSELEKSMEFTRSELTDLPTEKLAPLSRQVLATVELWRVKLGDYDVTDAGLRAFAEMIDNYDKVSAAPRVAINVRKNLGESLKALFRDADVLLDKQLDRMMEKFRSTEADFFREYHFNRAIINTGSRATQVSGVITDKVSGQPLRNVLVSMDGTAFLVNSKKDGSYSLKIPETGMIKLRVEIEGYKPVVMEAELKLGKTSEVNVEMEAA